ncbi:branched-chain amino acid ABC transporter permease [Aureimonas frigidaquae]|uniref:Putative branched-chain amino acid ABC transporter permease protein n=1 Tax=Aureimonas frigidaquae TaxID=424757 RepID=A0A0P0Z0F5_9HYPH|nr:branched-chain amino acid ABC transporter permease [Aureimonas frigidaquae]BAT27431.1 putative branched-chain amino acid ABC transporter permease protein [Aureimonas frigidaquae]
MRRVPAARLAFLVTGILVMAGAFLAGHVLTPFQQTMVGFAGINIILAVSLSFSNGLTGLFSLGHPAFMMVGGYTAAILTFPAARKAMMMPALPDAVAGIEAPFIVATLAGGMLAALVALISGFPVLRLKGHYLAVATIGLIVILRVVVNNADGVTRGAIGISGIPRLSTLPWIFGWALLTLFVLWRLKHGAPGRALMAIRENELAAAAIGVDRAAGRMKAFVLGAFFAGVGGALWAHLVTNLTPASFGIPLAFMLVAMVVIGGSGSLIGAAVAAIALSIVGEVMRPIERDLGAYGLMQITIALTLIAVMLLRPSGLFGGGEPISDTFPPKRRSMQ